MASQTKRTSLKDPNLSLPPTTTVVTQPRQQITLKSWFRMCYPHQSLDDLQNPVFWRDVFIETLLCMFVECCVIWALTTYNKDMYSPKTLNFGLWAGFFIYLLIEGYGPVSGAPMNPAGCWGFFLAGRMSAARMFFYTIGEVGGAAAGAMVGYSLQTQLVPTLQPSPEIGPARGMGIEAILTFNLLFVALSVTNPRGKIAIMPSFPIAFCIGTGIMAAGTHTGGLQNPIVPLGTAVVTKNFEHHWIYWVGPYIGATVGALVFQVCEFIKDHFEHHIVHTEETVGLHNPAHDGPHEH